MAATPRTRIRLCGPPALEIDGRDALAGLPGQARTLLEFLLAHRDRPADRDALVEVVWPQGPPENAKAHLRVLLSRLRRAVAPGELQGREKLRLALPEPVWVDTDEAASALEVARSAARDAAWTDALAAARAAFELLRPGYLSGVDGDWAAGDRAALGTAELEALELTARAGLALGGAELPAARRAAGDLVARSPFRESAHRLLMEAMAASGNVAEALQAYEDLRCLLRDELGVTPGPEAQALHRRLLEGDAAPAPAPLPALLAPREGGALVGREPELGRLRAAWADARAGRRRLVVLAGEPGIGKTRLASELAREAHAEGAVLYAGCQEDALVSYQPFVEALRHYALAVARVRVPPGPGGAELARLIPELRPPAPDGGEAAAGDPETRRYLLFEAVSALLTDAAGTSPVLLVLDDLHWADRPTLQLLRHVVRAQHHAALLIVGSYRETEIAPEHGLAELLADLRRDGLYERISLRGLDPPGVGALIQAHAGRAAPSALVETVHAETAGNPFFVGEVMRHLVETGAVSADGGRWTADVAPGDIGVPEGVEEVLARRLARLSEPCRLVLSHAAVLGRRFRFDLLPAMSGLDEDTVIGALEEALAARLVLESPDGTGVVHAFAHALVRETLYGGLSAPRRQRLHQRAAAAIEAGEAPDADASVAALAVHYRLAGPGVDPVKGIAACLRAGERARRAFAWEEASAHWDGAVALMERAGADPLERARLLVALADLSAVAGDLGRQIRDLERALSLYEEVGDARRAAQVHSRLGMAHSLIDSVYAEHFDLGRAFRHFDAARPVLERGPAGKALGHLETGVASAFTYGLSIGLGVEAAARAMDLAERAGDEALWAGAVQAYAWHKVVAGDLREGFDAAARGFEAADRGRRPFLAWMALSIQGQLTWGLGDPDSAQGYFERLLGLAYAGETAYRRQIADGVGRCHASRGEMAAARRLLSDAKPTWITHSLEPLVDLWDGEWERVEALARRVLATSRRTGNRWDEWASHHLAARVDHLRGRPDRAAASLDQARRIVVEGGARYFEAWVLCDLARVTAQLGRMADARLHAERLREIVGTGEDWRGRRGIAAVAEAVVLSLDGRADDAQARFAEGLGTLGRYGLVTDEADGLHQRGLALARAGDRQGAAEKLDAASELYRRHGAAPAWAARVERDRSTVGSAPAANRGARI